MDAAVPRVKPLRCVICHHVSHGYHFGVLSCRACAAFFRRTITENKVYKCRGSKKCPISKEQRNMCRACRYLKCEQNGMNKNDIQFNRDSIGYKPSPKKATISAESFYQRNSHGPNYIPTPSMHLSMPSNPISPPQNYNPPPLNTLERLKMGCTEYFFGQKGVPSSNNENQNLSLTYITHDAICRLEREHVPLICKMVSEYFTPFDKLDKPSKKYVLHQFFVKHQLTETVYQTYRHASNLPKDSWLLFDGFILDENDKGAIVPHSSIRHELLQFVEQVIKHATAVKKSIERLKVDDLERAAMSGIMLWQEVANAEPLWGEASNAQTVILSELHSHVLQKVGFSKTGSRIGALMSLINEVEAVARVFLLRETMEKIFDSKYSDAWESLEV
uniref:Nuclear receptor domain-containing protein n=1 Tax=Panagrellus redivivus TaxID=6233 RepID=A0A7E4UVP5_PANRE